MYEDETFEAVGCGSTPLDDDAYDGCTFIRCSFPAGSLSHRRFFDCTFDGCVLDMDAALEASFRDVEFLRCKLVGLRFEDCRTDLLSFGFTDCQLNLASFRGLRLRKTVFRDCNLTEADFTEADIRSSTLDDCDLTGAVFERTNLEKADLTTSYGYSIDPQRNRVRRARFSMPAVVGLLDRFGIEIR